MPVSGQAGLRQDILEHLVGWQTFLDGSIWGPNRHLFQPLWSLHMVKKQSKNTGFIYFFFLALLFKALVLIHLKGNGGAGEEEGRGVMCFTALNQTLLEKCPESNSKWKYLLSGWTVSSFLLQNGNKQCSSFIPKKGNLQIAQIPK